MLKFVVALAVVCGSTNLPAQGRAADEAALRAHAVAIENALNKRDAAALGALFTADGDEINGDGPLVSGREQCVAWTERNWQNGHRQCDSVLRLQEYVSLGKTSQL